MESNRVRALIYLRQQKYYKKGGTTSNSSFQDVCSFLYFCTDEKEGYYERKVRKIREIGLEKIDATKTIQELEDVRKDLMGKKSELADVMKNMGSLALEDKKVQV